MPQSEQHAPPYSEPAQGWYKPTKLLRAPTQTMTADGATNQEKPKSAKN